MFIETIELKGLIIYLKKNEFSYDFNWGKIHQKIPSVFIADNDAHMNELKSVISPHVNVIVESYSFFGISRSIKRALSILELQPYQVAFVTNNLQSLNNVLNEPIGSILMHPSKIPFYYHGLAPDFILESIDALEDVINGRTKGFFSEVCSTYLTENQTFGNSGFLVKTDLPRGPECEVYILGRYYDPKHFKHNMHQLSHRILRSKKNDSQNEIFADLFKAVIEQLIRPDGVTRVPPKPLETRDRLRPIVQSCIAKTTFEDLCDGLKCIRDYENHKLLGFDARYANVKGAFQANSRVEAKHIVLIDDVLTTGATVSECAKTLLEAGAKKVDIVVLASHQLSSEWYIWSTRETLRCPNCSDGEMILRLKRNNSFFYSCNKYPNCYGAMDFYLGWSNTVKLNTTECISDPDFSDFNF